MDNHSSPKTTLVILFLATGLILSAGFLDKPGIKEKIEQKLTTYSRDHLSEQLYLHLDKDLVLPGELLWFKAYRINPNPGIIRDKSKILTVEL
jgi:hypothetical protein